MALFGPLPPDVFEQLQRSSSSTLIELGCDIEAPELQTLWVKLGDEIPFSSEFADFHTTVVGLGFHRKDNIVVVALGMLGNSVVMQRLSWFKRPKYAKGDKIELPRQNPVWALTIESRNVIGKPSHEYVYQYHFSIGVDNKQYGSSDEEDLDKLIEGVNKLVE